jgi:hypothetical protein
MEPALSDVTAIYATLRSSLDPLGVHAAAQQLTLAQHQAAAQERQQNALALATSMATFIRPLRREHPGAGAGE